MLQITPFRWIWPGAFLWALLLVLPAAAQTSIDAKQYLDADAPDGGIQAAVDAAAEAGGGEVVLPAGRFELRRSIMLKDGLTLRGQGPDETVLVGQPESQWVRISNVASNEAGGTKLTVEQLPEGIAVGSSVFAFSDRPLKGYLGYYVPLLVTAIEGNTLTVDQKVHNQPKWLEYGLMSPAKQDVSKGTDRIAVHEPTLFAVGEAIAMGRADGNNNESLSFIKAIEGDTLVLERPIRRDEAGSKRGKRGTSPPRPGRSSAATPSRQSTCSMPRTAPSTT